MYDFHNSTIDFVVVVSISLVKIFPRDPRWQPKAPLQLLVDFDMYLHPLPWNNHNKKAQVIPM